MTGGGVSCVVLRTEEERELCDQEAGLFPHLEEVQLRYHASRLQLLWALREFDVIFSFTAAIGFRLGKLMYAYPLLRRIGWPPYVNVSTGADITERALEATWPGRLQRLTMRLAFAQGVPPYPDAVRTAARMRLSNACVLPPVQLTFGEDGVGLPPEEEWTVRTSTEELLLVAPSNLDWGEADGGPRASTKGNDRFLRALALFVRETDRPVRALVLERGADLEAARKLVDDLELSNHVVWRVGLPRRELFAAMREADVVVDQFDIGALGMIAWEAMNLGRPVLTYVDPTSERLAYDENAPILNAHTVDEILERLREIADRERLQELASRARAWACARTMASLLPRYLFYATLASGIPAADFGWDRPHGHQWVEP
jgi:glycosyltransferase involved in cell wall biosynthesis